jgi:hypothetical protein
MPDAEAASESDCRLAPSPAGTGMMPAVSKKVRYGESVIGRLGANDVLENSARPSNPTALTHTLVGTQANGTVDNAGIERQLEGNQLADHQRVDRRPGLDRTQLQNAVLRRQLPGGDERH